MTSRHLVDPELLPLLEMLPQRDMTPEILSPARAMSEERLRATPGPTPSDIVAVPGWEDAPPVSLRLFRPPSGVTAKGAVLHIHGGGFILGAAAMSDTANAAMAERHSVLVASVDYRLAPETPFPGPLEDCFAALAWLRANAAALGVPEERIVLAGESAGGGLAAALGLLSRDRGLPPLAGQLLTYPMLDPRSADSANPHTGEFVWSRNSNRYGWTAMQGGQDIAPARIHHFAPGLAIDLQGAPPTFIAVGALDLFLDEDLAFVARLSAAGVPVEAHVYPGAYHGFELMPGTQVGARFAADRAGALDRFLAT